MNRSVKIDESRVLITGGASGLGRQLALQTAARGAHVIIWDLDKSAASEVVDEIHARGGSADYAVIDITDRAAVDRAAQTAGDVDVVINNAGVVTGAWFLDAPPDKIERTYAVNVLALYWVTRAFLGGMIERDRGCVVTIASAAGYIGVAKQTDYSASKFAAVGFMESLRGELRTANSRVNALTVAPYYIDTGMFDGVTTRFPALLPILQQEPVAARIVRDIERGRAKLVLPWFVHVVPWVRILPVRAQESIADFFGLNRSMDDFRGRGN